MVAHFSNLHSNFPIFHFQDGSINSMNFHPWFPWKNRPGNLQFFPPTKHRKTAGPTPPDARAGFRAGPHGRAESPGSPWPKPKTPKWWGMNLPLLCLTYISWDLWGGIYIYRYISYIIRYHVMINIYITYIILYLFRTPNCSPQIMMAMESGSQKCWFEESKLLLWTKKWGFIFWFSILKWGSFGGRASMIRRMGHANIPCEGLPLCRWRCCFHVPNIYIYSGFTH